MLLNILRGVYVAMIIGVATGLAIQSSAWLPAETGWSQYALWATFGAILLIGLSVVALDIFIPKKDITTFSAVYLGLLVGLSLAYLLSSGLRPILEPTLNQQVWGLIQLFLAFLFCYLCVSTLLQTKNDFRFIIPYVEFSRQVKGPKPLLLDTSVIIDGRIADIADTRLLDCKMIVPRFVLRELQNIADANDPLRRKRGRRGLDILKRLQTNPHIEVEVLESDPAELADIGDVDQRLVRLAKNLGARIITTDFSLNKIAQVEGVEVVNMNDLANAVRVAALPGETLHIRLIRPGEQPGQAVGWLEDGTMVVAEQGRSYIGQEVTITVTSVHQSPAGRMIFGRVERPAASQPVESTPSR
ncbi:MAG: PIN/TRAM domain-containing protein [Gemmatales bacterium]|nr:PIN/TRAM domain-containing protein [Gemmatales bacterium]MDW7995139.1 PIN/TRAM domain-containing protein [Gemmatales bacterium]